MLSLCSLLSEEPKLSKHQGLISTWQEIAFKKSFFIMMSYQGSIYNHESLYFKFLL